MNGIKRYLPFLQWLPNYEKRNFKGDLTAGLTTAVMLIPQAMAYAMLAGLPPTVGLYASIVPVAIYALMGTSRQLAVGPVAMVSLLLAVGVGQMADGGTETYIALAVVLALMVGVIQVVMGLGKLGFLTNFLSHPVLSGFTSAAALIIGFSQLKHLLGVDIPRSHHVHETIWNAIQAAGSISLVTVGIGLAAIAVLVFLKKKFPSVPRALVVVVAGTLAVWGLSLGVNIVGHVPAGLPAPSLPDLSGDAMWGLLPTALTIAFVGFMESIAVAKSFATRNRYELDANQELVALGTANIGGSFFGAYPVTGGFSRTAVNANAGAKTGLASLITAAVVGLAVLFMTPLFFFLPKAVLAAIIVVAVYGLIDVKEVKHLWKVKRSDLALWGVTFVATLSLGIEQGILAGVGVSMVWFFVRTTRPHFAVLGRIDGTQAYRNIENHQSAKTIPGMLIVRMDAQFYFGNVSFLKQKLKTLRGQAAHDVIVIDASSMNQLDSSADTALHELIDDLESRGQKLLLANIKEPVREVMRRSHLIERLGEENIFLTVHEAVCSVQPEVCNDQPDSETEDAAEKNPTPEFGATAVTMH